MKKALLHGVVQGTGLGVVEDMELDGVERDLVEDKELDKDGVKRESRRGRGWGWGKKGIWIWIWSRTGMGKINKKFFKK